MPKMMCRCGGVLNLSYIPNPIEWRLLSDTDYDAMGDVIKWEEIENISKPVVECPQCRGLWVFWNGFDGEPVYYARQGD